MNYHNITKDDMLNGDGIRVVLWVSGCSMHCKGCQNPQTWDRESGIKFDSEALNELLDALNHDYIQGLTISGGHPLEDYNLSEVENICKTVKKRYPKKDIWLYTGYNFSDIIYDPIYSEILSYVDVIVDGKYNEKLRDLSLPYRGSSNQTIWRRSLKFPLIWIDEESGNSVLYVS